MSSEEKDNLNSIMAKPLMIVSYLNDEEMASQIKQMPQEQANLMLSKINEQLDDIRATLVRQTMFAEFEKIVHERIEKGESLSSDELNNIYFDPQKS